ncbi:hypothetical protein KFL_000230020 [Klebsormidium nitens]|uniref:Uncharacterized protein n=1 Tax=Klebsormidium nitens TaxID=105231 RepID=A0A1Y1HPW4_KLENI|nr:hypothetical protein KFL_000230020 [Klebsormidium nitens]|eukprot:GAQ79021.1 hypothetical protein KFL_000230020 [Klebsormidium nitens]
MSRLLQQVPGLARRLSVARPAAVNGTRSFSASAGHGTQEEALAEMAKWRNVSIAAVVACAGLTAYDLVIAPEEHHHHEKKKYSYLHIRNKAFPWGPCGLFEYDCNPDEEPVV